MRIRPDKHLRRTTLLLAWLAVAVNALAPVLAYVYGDAMHVHGDQPVATDLFHHHHDADHAIRHAVHHAADQDDSHSTSHCPHCLDFAGAPALAATLTIFAAFAPAAESAPPIGVATIHGRPSLRIAQSRAPPARG
jgi:hypothetical protein